MFHDASAFVVKVVLLYIQNLHLSTMAPFHGGMVDFCVYTYIIFSPSALPFPVAVLDWLWQLDVGDKT